MRATCSGLVLCSLALSVVAGPVLGYADRAARDLVDRETYVSVVLPGGTR